MEMDSVDEEDVAAEAGVEDSGGMLQLALWSMKNLSQPLTNQSWRNRSMPSEQRSAVEHHTHSNWIVLVMHDSQLLNETHVGNAVK